MLAQGGGFHKQVILRDRAPIKSGDWTPAARNRQTAVSPCWRSLRWSGSSLEWEVRSIKWTAARAHLALRGTSRPTAPGGHLRNNYSPRLLLPLSGHKHSWQWHHSGVNWQVIRGPRRFSSSRGRQCAPVNGNLLATFVVARRVCFLEERRWIVELVDLEPIDWLMRFRCASYPQKKISI